jgi:ankyrin repeat protein
MPMYTRQMAYGDDIPLKCSPLICAAWFGHLEVARLLLERGADIEAKAIVRAPTACCVGAQRGRHTSGVKLAAVAALRLR